MNVATCQQGDLNQIILACDYIYESESVGKFHKVNGHFENSPKENSQWGNLDKGCDK